MWDVSSIVGTTLLLLLLFQCPIYVLRPACSLICGSMREFCSLDMPVFMVDKEGKHIVMTMGELLPMSFGPEIMTGGERE